MTAKNTRTRTPDGPRTEDDLTTEEENLKAQLKAIRAERRALRRAEEEAAAKALADAAHELGEALTRALGATDPKTVYRARDAALGEDIIDMIATRMAGEPAPEDTTDWDHSDGQW